MTGIESQDHADIFVAHAYLEHTVDLGEIRMNYVTLGNPDLPALLLLPAQTESWWGYEEALPLLAEHFQVYSVDLRGQGRSTWTPGRYTLDNWGNDLVRFIELVIGRATIVSGNSSGGVISAWMAAYAEPGQLRGVVLEDPPLFASELITSCGQSIRQSAVGRILELSSKWLGDQWTIGDWTGMQAAARTDLPAWAATAMAGMAVTRGVSAHDGPPRIDSPPPQNMREYDPEWARAFLTGTATAGCDHARMLSSVRVPVLLTHHYHDTDADSGSLMGAVSDLQVRHAKKLIIAAGQPVDTLELPGMAHQMHQQDPELFTRTVVDWSTTLAAPT